VDLVGVATVPPRLKPSLLAQELRARPKLYPFKTALLKLRSLLSEAMAIMLTGAATMGQFQGSGLEEVVGPG